MAYSYKDRYINSKVSEECVFISSASRSSGNISNFTIQLHETIIGTYRIDMISYSYQRIPNIPFIGIKISQVGNTCNSNNVVFIINNNDSVDILDGNSIVSRTDLVNTYGLFNIAKTETLTELTISFINLITGAPITMLADNHWVMRFKYVRDIWELNVQS